MKTLMMYETKDGKRFNSLEAAEAWENQHENKRWRANLVFTYSKPLYVYASSCEEALVKAKQYANEIGNELIDELPIEGHLSWEVSYFY